MKMLFQTLVVLTVGGWLTQTVIAADDSAKPWQKRQLLRNEILGNLTNRLSILATHA